MFPEPLPGPSPSVEDVGLASEGLAPAAPGLAPAVRLVASPEPTVVFAGLAARCAPALCDDCTVELEIGAHGEAAALRIVEPRPGRSGGGLVRLADAAAVDAGHTVRVPFAGAPALTPAPDDTTSANSPHPAFVGVATFVWHRREVTDTDRMLVETLVDLAVRTVMWQRSEVATAAAATRSDHLMVALENSRRIGAAMGILMSNHKIAEQQAFDLLRVASQRGNRKLRDVADGVIETGWLDPAMLRGSRQGGR
ncbi:ANTAR domain-containing protein [Jatrophihabitans fulvus]